MIKKVFFFKKDASSLINTLRIIFNYDRNKFNNSNKFKTQFTNLLFLRFSSFTIFSQFTLDTLFWVKTRVLYYINNWVYTTNHKRIAVNYFWFVILSGIVGMVLATLMRLEFAYPGVGVFAGDSLQYLSTATAHGVIMVFFMIMPLLLGAFANFLIPTQLGVHDVAFPRLNSAAFWFLPGGLLMLCQLVCVDRRYQRMNCFNIREIQSILKRKFFTDLINTHDHHTILNKTAMGLRFKTNGINSFNSNIFIFYNYGIEFSSKIRSNNYLNDAVTSNNAGINLFTTNSLFFNFITYFSNFNFFNYINKLFFILPFSSNQNTNSLYESFSFLFNSFIVSTTNIYDFSSKNYQYVWELVIHIFGSFKDFFSFDRFDLIHFFSLFTNFLNNLFNNFFITYINIIDVKYNYVGYFTNSKIESPLNYSYNNSSTLSYVYESLLTYFEINFSYFAPFFKHSIISECVNNVSVLLSYYNLTLIRVLTLSWINDLSDWMILDLPKLTNVYNQIDILNNLQYSVKILNYFLFSNYSLSFNFNSYHIYLYLILESFLMLLTSLLSIFRTFLTTIIEICQLFANFFISLFKNPQTAFYESSLQLYNNSVYLTSLIENSVDHNYSALIPGIYSYFSDLIALHYPIFFNDHFSYFYFKIAILNSSSYNELSTLNRLAHAFTFYFNSEALSLNFMISNYYNYNTKMLHLMISLKDKLLNASFSIFFDLFRSMSGFFNYTSLFIFETKTNSLFNFFYNMFEINSSTNLNYLVNRTLSYSSKYFSNTSSEFNSKFTNEEMYDSSRYLKFYNPVFKYDYKSGDYLPKTQQKLYTHLFTSISDITNSVRTASWFYSENFLKAFNDNFSEFSNNMELNSKFSSVILHQIKEHRFSNTDAFYNFFSTLSEDLNYTNKKWIALNSLNQKFYKLFNTSSMQQRIYSNWRQLKFTREAWRCKLLAARHQKTLFRRYIHEDGIFWSIERNAKDLLPGWAMITPFSARTRFTAVGKTDIGLMGVFLVLNSSIISAANFLVTYRYLSTLNNRKMRDARVFFTESIIVANWMMIFANPMLAIAILMLLSDRHWQTSFFDYSGGGDTVLFQHMFWFFGHPEVYIIIIPTFGFANSMLSYYLRKRVSARASLMYSMYTIAFLGFFVWGHHMYMVGLSHTTRMLFSTLTVMISVPAATKIMHWSVTIVNSSIAFELPLLFSLTFIFLFVSGGISGMCVAHTGMDILFHDTFYVIGHFHVMLSGAAMFSSFGAFYFYFPAIFGVKYSRIYAYLHYVYYLIGQLMTVIPMLWLGYAGMPRRVLDYPASMGGWHSVISAGHMLSVAGLIAFFIMIFDSLRQGRAVTRNTFGIARYNTRLNFYLYEISKIHYVYQKSSFLFRLLKPTSIKLNNLNYTNFEPYETTLITYTFEKK